MTIKRASSGRVLLNGGKVACACCGLSFPFAFSIEGVCNCKNEEMGCYSSAVPSRAQDLYVPVSEVDWNVPTTANDVFADRKFLFLLQGPIFSGQGIPVGWRALVTDTPKLFTLSGRIGGDVVFIGLTTFWDGYAPGPVDPEAPNFAEVPQQGVFACDKCEQPRNAYCNISASFVMYPNVAYYLHFINYFYAKQKIDGMLVDAYGGACTPFFKGNISLSSVPAP